MGLLVRSRFSLLVSLLVSLLSWLLRMLSALVADALSPAACAACNAPLVKRTVFCGACAGGILQPEPSGVTASSAFGGPVAVALRRFKYESRPDLAGPLGHLLRRTARKAGLFGGAVVPVPLHPCRLAERGYNQAALLAVAVAQELGAPLFPCALARVRNTPQQARLDRSGRLKNVEGAFHVADPSAVLGRRVILVDDVATTGATLEACTKALLRAGAESVSALVVARAGGSSVSDQPLHGSLEMLDLPPA